MLARRDSQTHGRGTLTRRHEHGAARFEE